MEKPLISIVIPTKNRYKYLVGALESFLLLTRTEFEVIVQDNSDDNTFIIKYIEEHKEYTFLKYFYCGDHLSMSENSDMAIAHSSGRYVCFLGDDDSVTDKIFEVAEYMEQHQCDSCFGKINRFHWQDFRDTHPGAKPYKSYKCKREYKVVDTMKVLDNVLKDGALGMMNLPRVYHGMVNRSLLNAIKERTGTFFPGPSPDMASAVAIAVFAKKHVQTSVPFVISGFSSNSGGGSGKGSNYGGDIKKVGYLPNNIMDIWDERIPKFMSGQTIWPVTMLYALKQCGKESLCDKCNFNYIYANLYIQHPELMRKTKCRNVSKIKVTPLFVSSFFRRGAAFVFRKLMPVSKETDFVIDNSVQTLSDALNYELRNNQ